MNAPYDGERDREAEDGQVPPTSSPRAGQGRSGGYPDGHPGYGYPQGQYPPDAYQQGSYPRVSRDDPYRGGPAGGYGDQGQPAQGYGDDPGYQDPRYADPRYQAQGHGGGYQGGGYQDPNAGYGGQGYQDPHQGYQQGGYQDPNAGQGYPQGGYQQGGYQDPGYQGGGYQDPGYQDPNAGYGGQGYQDPHQGYQQGGYQDPNAGQGYPQGGYQGYQQNQQPQQSQGYQDPNAGYGGQYGGGYPYDQRGQGGQGGGWDDYQAYYQQAYAHDSRLSDTYIGDTLYGQLPPIPDVDALYDDPRSRQSAPGQAGQYPPPPDPRLYAPTPTPEPPGSVGRRMPYGDRNAAGYVGVDEFVSGNTPGQDADDPYAHLFRDQRTTAAPTAAPPRDPAGPGGPATGVRPAPSRPAPPPPPAQSGGKSGGILKSSALMAAGTMVSRITGFLRTLVIAAAIGLSSLADIYQVANVLPTMVYILTIGGGLNSVFVPQLVRAMRNDEDGGIAYANRLLTLVMVVLGGIVAVTWIAAPLLIKAMSAEIANDPVKLDVAVTFARYCLPTIFFMGMHVVMGQILNARGRFGAMMWTPVLNNVVTIFTFGMFIWVFGSFDSTEMGAETISPEGVRLLGIGTLLGLAVQALSMLPYLREAGFRFRPRFDWRGHGLGKAAKLAKWTFLFVLANQVGLIVVTQLATVAGSTAERQGHSGAGITGYQNAQLIWQMPQAIITVSVMAAVLPRISRAAADGDRQAVRDDISYGLRTSAVAIVPAAFAFVALGIPMSTLMYASSGNGARMIGFILMAFGLGLIPFSVQYVVLRGFYAYEDTRTPFFNTVIVAASMAAMSALCYLVLPSRWVVTGMAASYGISYLIGVQVAAKRLRHLLGGDIDGARVMRTYARLIGACLPAALCAGGTSYLILESMGNGFVGSAAALLAGGTVLLLLFVAVGKRMRIEEMTALVGTVRGKLGR